MAARGEVLPLLGGAALTDDHAALWLAALELLAQLQRKTGAGRLRRGPRVPSFSLDGRT
jgi:hypothetical protein